MQIIEPVEIDLAFTGTSSDYVYPTVWASGVTYVKNTIIRYVTGGVSRDYRCLYTHTSVSYSYPPNWYWYWTDLGLSATTGGYTYTTNVRLSANTTWAASVALAADVVRYDPANNHDYQTVIALASGDNTLRPSEAVLSATEAVAARWIDLGAANAWAALDQQNNTYLKGYDDNGAILAELTTSINVATSAVADAICFDGLYNCDLLTITPTLGGVAGTPIVVTNPARSLVVPLASTKAAGTTLSLACALSRDVATLPVKLGLMCVGLRVPLASTEWEVETSMLSFSRKERDEVYGTVTFVRRGSAKLVKARCYVDPAVVSGDVVMQTLEAVDGRPVFWDFNNGVADYARLRLFGFFTDLATVIKAESYESLSLTVEGLVE